MNRKQLPTMMIAFIICVFAFASDVQNPSSPNSENANFYLSILVAILTVLGSGVVAAWVSHYLVKQKEDLFCKRAKLEHLYKYIERYTTLLFTTNHMWPRVMSGDIDFNAGLDMQIENNDKENKILLPEIDMLINLYFPEFLVGYNNLIEKRDKVNELNQRFKSIYKLHGPTVDYSTNKDEFSKALLGIDNASKKLLYEVSRYAKTMR